MEGNDVRFEFVGRGRPVEMVVLMPLVREIGELEMACREISAGSQDSLKAPLN